MLKSIYFLLSPCAFWYDMSPWIIRCTSYWPVPKCLKLWSVFLFTLKINMSSSYTIIPLRPSARLSRELSFLSLQVFIIKLRNRILRSWLRMIEFLRIIFTGTFWSKIPISRWNISFRLVFFAKSVDERDPWWFVRLIDFIHGFSRTFLSLRLNYNTDIK